MTTVPKIRGFRGTSNAGTSTIAVNVPTDSTAPAVGDEMNVALVITSASSIPTPPTGWTQILAPQAMGTRYLVVFRKIRASGDPNSVTFTMNTSGAAISFLFYGAAVYGGIGSYLRTSTGNVQTTPGVTTAKANSLVISVQGEATAATETTDKITVASPFVKDTWYLQEVSSPIHSVLLSHREMTTAGASGDASSTWLKDDGTANSSGNRGSVMLIWEPVPDATPAPVTQLSATVVNEQGNAVSVGLTAIDSSGTEVAISKLEFVHGGTMVPDLDRATRVWTMGHRGGSVDYQEHSPEGYLNCAINHIDVFEFSVGITKDKKFFGIHDGTFSRTSSSVASGVKTTDLTWSEVQALVQDLPNRADTRYGTSRYMSLDEFIERWSATHTLMFDPKLIATADRPALYSRLQQIPDYRRRVLGKFYHTGTTIADEFAAIGVGSWGYSYEADVGSLDANGNFVVRTDSSSTAATASKWKYLGLDYGASDKAWAAMRTIAGDKKIIGHICPTVGAAQSAVGKGARALQVSGVRAVSAAY